VSYQPHAYSTFQKAAFALNEAVKELLYNHVDPVLKQWVRNLNNLIQIIVTLYLKIRPPVITVPHEVAGAPIPQSERVKLAAGLETDLVTGLTSKAGRPFSAFLLMDKEGKPAFRFPENSTAAANSTQHGPISTSFMGVELQPEDVLALEKGDETQLVKGLKGKKGIPFDAYLKLDPNKRIQLRFDQKAKKEEPAPDKLPTQSQAPVNTIASLLKEGIYGRKFSDAGITRLLAGEKSPLLSGFVSPTGKRFEAVIEIKGGRLLMHIPERKLNTGLKIVPTKLLGVEISKEDREKIKSGRSTSLIRDMRSPGGVVFSGWVKADTQKVLWIKSAAVEREIKPAGIAL